MITYITVYFLYPLEDFLKECFSDNFFKSWFILGLACLSIIGVIHIIRRFAFESFRREVLS